jgi:hypothetical protein
MFDCNSQVSSYFSIYNLKDKNMQLVASKEKPLKTGFSWTILLFSWFFGLPLFSRKLIRWGILFISMDLIFFSYLIDALAPILSQLTVDNASTIDPLQQLSAADLAYMREAALHARQTILAIVIFSIFFAFKGNGMAAKKAAKRKS